MRQRRWLELFAALGASELKAPSSEPEALGTLKALLGPGTLVLALRMRGNGAEVSPVVTRFHPGGSCNYTISSDGAEQKSPRGRHDRSTSSAGNFACVLGFDGNDLGDSERGRVWQEKRSSFLEKAFMARSKIEQAS
jgi:hypothetical protein